jgi:hypothetical protein
MEQVKPMVPLSEKIRELEGNIRKRINELMEYLSKPNRELSFADRLLALDVIRAYEDYSLVKEILMPECVDEEIYLLVSKDFDEITNYAIKYFKDNVSILKDRIGFRVSLFKQDIYSFIKGCADILD